LTGPDLYRNSVALPRDVQISVLSPFLRDDPRALMRSIAAMAQADGLAIEMLVLDDGSNDAALTASIKACIDELPIPAALITLAQNGGRSAARNALARAAAGAWFLFLDADIIPDGADLLTTYQREIAAHAPAMLIGGFSIRHAPGEPRYRLHRFMTDRMDCLPAATRNRLGWRFCFGCNVLIRRDVMFANMLDEAYLHWGWEDQEWGLRVSLHHEIRHIDNTVSHVGLNDVPTLMRKYAESGVSFRKILRDHPGPVRDCPAYRAYRLLRLLPGHRLLRAPVGWLAGAEWLPSLALRAWLLRAYRALHYVA